MPDKSLQGAPEIASDTSTPAPAPSSEKPAAATASFGKKLTSIQPIHQIQIPQHLRLAVRSTDHTALGRVEEKSILDLCHEAAMADPHPNSVCVQGPWAAVAKRALRAMGCGDSVKVCAVGERHFPKDALDPIDSSNALGYRADQLPGTAPLEDKLTDVSEALGTADIFDMVLNAQLVLEGHEAEAVAEIQMIRAQMDKIKPEAPLRVISSTGMLRAIGGEAMVQRACRIVAHAAEGLAHGMVVMKTETGFINNPEGGKFGATVPDIALMRRELPHNVEIKASGGVNAKNAEAILGAGANYIGASGLLREALKSASSETSAY